MSAKILNIKRDSHNCELHEIKVLRSVDTVPPEKEMAAVNQQMVTKETSEALREGLAINDANIAIEERENLQRFLIQWKDVFS